MKSEPPGKRGGEYRNRRDVRRRLGGETSVRGEGRFCVNQVGLAGRSASPPRSGASALGEPEPPRGPSGEEKSLEGRKGIKE